MAETKNIDEMAKIISDKIFLEMKWKANETYTDINWDCCSKHHDGKTHPSDVVFSYIEPYSELKQYIQTDLKSYKKDTISPAKIGNALISLGKQVVCARKSPEWAGNYREGESQYGLHGMLFIYNNDDEYDKNLLNSISSKAGYNFELPQESTLNIFTPQLIRFLMTVVENIKERRVIENYESEVKKLQKIPSYPNCGFYYPDKHNKCASNEIGHAASIEMITSGMLLFEYVCPTDKKRVLNIYWDEKVSSEGYFVYLFEYIFNYQMLNLFERIYVITPFSQGALKYFDRATSVYKSRYMTTETQKRKLERIDLLHLDCIKTNIFPFTLVGKDGSSRHLIKEVA